MEIPDVDFAVDAARAKQVGRELVEVDAANRAAVATVAENLSVFEGTREQLVGVPGGKLTIVEAGREDTAWVGGRDVPPLEAMEAGGGGGLAASIQGAKKGERGGRGRREEREGARHTVRRRKGRRGA